jgi:peptidoglycan/LPS O-acetylase OafA/YrhL
LTPARRDGNPSAPSRAGHIPALDGLRAVAILCVLATHAWTYPASAPILNRLAAAGWVGVDLFFVLSGFLITRLLLASRERGDYYSRFFVRRVRRIFPAYYLLLGLVLLAFPLMSHSAGLMAARHDWLYYATYLSNVRLAEVGWQVFLLDITWSLAVEEQFYVTWPWIVRRFAGSLRAIAWTLVVAIPLVRIAAMLIGWPSRS